MPAPSYCPDCGAALVDRTVEGRTRRACDECDTIHYRNPKPCAGVVVVDGGAALLVERSEPPSVGAWSLPAGYLEVDESPRAGAVRELEEETGLVVDASALSILGTRYVDRGPGDPVVVIAFAAAADETTGEVAAGSDAADARFRTPAGIDAADERLEPGYRDLVRQAIELF